MKNRWFAGVKAFALSIVLIGSIAIQGCTYLKQRGHDALDIVDVGLTFSKKPYFAAYYDFIPIVPIGYGEVDGKYVGIGKGDLCFWSDHYERSYGAILWGQEDVTFRKGKSELDRMSAADREIETDFQRTGLVGMTEGPFPGPNYLISCPHYLHIGWIGAVASPRYLHILDFVLGWTTLDIGGDDAARAGGSKPEEKNLSKTEAAVKKSRDKEVKP